MNAAEGFALSLVSLALARKGFRSAKNVLLPNGTTADLLVTGTDPRLGHNPFVIVFKAVNDEDEIPRRIDRVLHEYTERFGMETHLAFFVDRTDTLIVDQNLAAHMHFSDPEIKLKTIDTEALPAPTESELPAR